MKKYSFHIWLLILILGFELIIMSGFMPFEVVWKVSLISVLGMVIAYVGNIFVFFPRYFNSSSLRSNWKYILLSMGLTLVVAILFTYWDLSLSLEFRNPPREHKYPYLFPVIGRFMGLSILQLIGTFAMVLQRLNKQIQQTEQARSDYFQSELKLLKAQVNPHFLFNALNNIYSLSYMKSDDAPKSVLRLSNMLRHVLRDDDQDSVALSSELQYIEDYIAFQQLRMPENGNVRFEQQIDNEYAKLPQMLLMPFVENSFKYSRIEEENPDAFIHISVSTKGKSLHFTIRNNKPGNPVPSGNQTGIRNVRKRLEILYPKKHHLKIKDANDTFEVDLKIELL